MRPSVFEVKKKNCDYHQPDNHIMNDVSSSCVIYKTLPY